MSHIIDRLSFFNKKEAEPFSNDYGKLVKAQIAKKVSRLHWQRWELWIEWMMLKLSLISSVNKLK